MVPQYLQIVQTSEFQNVDKDMTNNSSVKNQRETQEQHDPKTSPLIYGSKQRKNDKQSCGHNRRNRVRFSRVGEQIRGKCPFQKMGSVIILSHILLISGKLGVSGLD